MTVAEPYSPEFFVDPYPTLARLREERPVSRVRAFGFVDSWFVAGYDRAREILTDPRFRKALPGQPSPFMPPIDGPAVATMDSDPPEHTRLRKLMLQGFTHRRVGHLRERITQLVEAACDDLERRGGGDLVLDLAYPLPMTIMCDILGVPPGDRAEVAERSAGLRRDSGLSGFEMLQRNLTAIKQMQEYFAGLLARKRAEPGDDLVSALLAARDGADRLSEDELLAMLMFLLFAGYVTTVSLLAGGVRTLLDHPDQLTLLRERPELVTGAIEECLRFESPFMGAGRIAGADLRFAGADIRRGDSVIISLNAANRDPAVFADPDRFDITRKPNPHLAFGLGIHHCVGASLARLEAEVVFGTLFRRFPELRPAHATGDWGSDGVVRAIAELEVRTGRPGPLPPLSYERAGVLDVAPALRPLRHAYPVRARTPYGDPAWFVTRHADVKQLINDPRVGRSHHDPANAPRVFEGPLGGPLGGGAGGMTMGNGRDPAQVRAAMRTVMAGAFSPGRMRALQPRIEGLIDDLLTRFTGLEQPADLHAEVCWTLPVLVICELLEVPPEDRAKFGEWSAGTLEMGDFGKAMTAWQELSGYMRELVDRRRQRLSDDVVSELIRAQPTAGLTDDDVVYMASGLLAGGYETTVARLDLGTVLLLAHPEQRAVMLAGPAATAGGVEEILRFAVPGGAGLPRYAQEDLMVGGRLIRRGEAVLLDFNLANRDPEVFDDPDEFDVARTPNPHLSFSHGARSCLGAALGRIELRAFFPRLFDRLPGLRLAEPVERLRVRDVLLTGGLTSLPVRW